MRANHSIVRRKELRSYRSDQMKSSQKIPRVTNLLRYGCFVPRLLNEALLRRCHHWRTAIRLGSTNDQPAMACAAAATRMNEIADATNTVLSPWRIIGNGVVTNATTTITDATGNIGDALESAHQSSMFRTTNSRNRSCDWRK